jgi:hypothetical protein
MKRALCSALAALLLAATTAYADGGSHHDGHDSAPQVADWSAAQAADTHQAADQSADTSAGPPDTAGHHDAAGHHHTLE